MPFAVAGPASQIPQHVAELINRVCGLLNGQRKQVGDSVRGLVPENCPGTSAYRMQDFIAQAEREYHVNNAEASQLAQFFSVASNPTLFDFGRFSQLITNEQRKYDSLLLKYDMELRLLQD